MRVTIMFILHFLLLRESYAIFDLHNFVVDADQNATFSFLTYLRLTQFSYTEIGNFSDNFISLKEKRNFDTLRFATFITIFMFFDRVT